MKLLKIENSQGLFMSDNQGFESVDKLKKEDLLRLVDLVLKEESAEFDAYDESQIKNQAHQIIYKSVHSKLSELHGRRDEFVDESKRIYSSEYEKYRDKNVEPDKLDS